VASLYLPRDRDLVDQMVLQAGYNYNRLKYGCHFPVLSVSSFIAVPIILACDQKLILYLLS